MTIGSQISSRRGDARPTTTCAGSGIGRLRPSTSARAALSAIERRQSILTAVADSRPGRFAGHGFDVAPASLAFDAVGATDGDGGFTFLGFAVPDLDVRDDEQRGETLLVLPEKRRISRRGGQYDLRLERFSDAFVHAKPLDVGVHPLAQRQQPRPSSKKRGVGERLKLRDAWKDCEVYRFVPPPRQEVPHLLRGD